MASPLAGKVAMGTVLRVGVVVVLCASSSSAQTEYKIAFATDRDGGNVEIYVMDEDGSNPRNLTRTETTAIYPVWISDEAVTAIRAMSWGQVNAGHWPLQWTRKDGEHDRSAA